MRNRSIARERALQKLYQIEFKNDELNIPDAENTTKDIETFAQELVDGVKEKQAELDETIQKKLDNWEINRLAVIDRIILRLGAYEIVFRSDIPPVVSINEAVDLAKKYGSESSGAFINGVLDKIFQSRE
ncbi:MAG: transcription antitermination factor NusB [Planctomycetes bacterium]|nr:transcription antitermination factor NusB [Planctomycetota bacterium]